MRALVKMRAVAKNRAEAKRSERECELTTGFIPHQRCPALFEMKLSCEKKGGSTPSMDENWQG